MTHWMSRFRRSAIVLLGMHLLQATALSASPVCAPATAMTDVTSRTTMDAPVHMHHGAHADVLPGLGAASTAPAGEPHGSGPSPAAPHGPASAACPMAMTCTVVAVVSVTPVFTSRVVAVADAPAIETWLAPHSLGRAPDTPPPRG